MDLSLILTVAGVIVAWLGFLEKRFYDMSTRLEKRIEEKNEVNRIIQKDIQDDIARLESKIDMLINIQIQNNKGKD